MPVHNSQFIAYRKIRNTEVGAHRGIIYCGCLGVLIFWYIVILAQTPGFGATYYVDPGLGSMSNDGSYNNPWRTAEEVFTSGLIGSTVRPGDMLLLRNGYHGEILCSNARNAGYITVAAETGHAPHLKKIHFNSSAKWIVRGLTVSPEGAPGAYESDYLVYIGPDCDDIIVDSNTLFYTQDSTGWTANEWNALPGRYMIYTRGTNIIIRNNALKNMNFGIVITGEHTLIENNLIENIAGDGMVGSANNITIQHNTIKNFYKVNENHDDAIQFHRGVSTVTIENVVVRGNFIMSHEQNLTYPLMTSPQGICGFSSTIGFFNNYLIENNVVLLQHWHGISLYGALDSRIMNNIVFDPTGAYPTWISLGDTGGKNTVVRNNMASTYSISGENIAADHNIDIDTYGPEALFVDYHTYDLKHKEGSPAIDTGSEDLAPSIDIDGFPRPQGTGYDIGAYEYGASSGTTQPPQPPQPPEPPVNPADTPVPSKTEMNCYNNVFNPVKGEEATISVELDKQARVAVVIYDNKGKEIKKFMDEEKQSGFYTLKWNGKDDTGNTVGSGIYVVQMKTDNYKEIRKIAIIK